MALVSHSHLDGTLAWLYMSCMFWIRRHIGYTDSINAVKPGADFGRLMLEAAIIADDYAAVAKWSMDVANRWRHLIGEQLRRIGEITGEGKPWAYACGIFKHLGLPASWEDIPEDRLADVFKMLDTHRRRLIRKAAQEAP